MRALPASTLTPPPAGLPCCCWASCCSSLRSSAPAPCSRWVPQFSRKWILQRPAYLPGKWFLRTCTCARTWGIDFVLQAAVGNRNKEKSNYRRSGLPHHRSIRTYTDALEPSSVGLGQNPELQSPLLSGGSPAVAHRARTGAGAVLDLRGLLDRRHQVRGSFLRRSVHFLPCPCFLEFFFSGAGSAP